LDFENALAGLKVPVRTLSLRMPGSNVTHNSQTIYEHMKGDWLWLMGDDHTFSPDLLLNLLDHQVDVVVPICARRAPPFWTLLYKDLDVARNICSVYSWEELSRLDGLIPITGAGSGGMLIRKYVLEKLDPPVFENARTPDGKNIGEDLTLCHKINKAGFTIWADLDQTMGHISSCDIRPVRVNGAWTIDGVFDGRTAHMSWEGGK